MSRAEPFFVLLLLTFRVRRVILGVRHNPGSFPGGTQF